MTRTIHVELIQNLSLPNQAPFIYLNRGELALYLKNLLGCTQVVVTAVQDTIDSTPAASGTYRIESFLQIKQLADCAGKAAEPVTVTDSAGSIADGRSLLGLMSLCYTTGLVTISCADETFFSSLEKAWGSRP